MIQIIPHSKRKVHHEVAAVRSIASLPPTAQFGPSAPDLSKENDRTKAGLFDPAFLFNSDELETVPFCPILSISVTNLPLLASRLDFLIHLRLSKKWKLKCELGISSHLD